MKLELKHLAGYLPYGLKVRHSSWNEILTMDCCGDNSESLSILDIEQYAKPILHPLSDLTKEIEVNGENFVPIEIIQKDFYWDYVKNNMRDLIKDNDYSLIEYLPYMVVEKLLEWHFDIYNLIENNLAIDKNTIL